MKLVRASYRNFTPHRNWCWVENGPTNNSPENDNWENALINDDLKRESLENSEKADKILELVKSPLQFSFRVIKFIEDNERHLSAPQKTAFRVGFRKITEYFLSLSVVDSTVMPPRILYQISGSKLSRQVLPNKLKKAVDLITSTQLKEIRDLSEEDPSSWSTGKTVKLLALYRHLKKENNKSGKNLDHDFKLISEKLVKKAISISEQESLSTADRLILWELQRLLKTGSINLSTDIRNKLHRKGEIEAREVLHKILTDNEQKNNPDLILCWDILEDLAYQNEISINEDGKKKLRKFVLRSNATQLLEALSKMPTKVILPIHKKALKDLHDDNFKALFEATDDDFEESIRIERTKEDDDRITQYEEKLKAIRKKISDTEDIEFENLLSSGQIKKPQAEAYQEAKDDLDTFWNDFRTSQEDKSIADIINELKGKFENKQPFSNRLNPLFTKLERTQNAKKKFEITKEIIQIIQGFKTTGLNEVIKKENEGSVMKKAAKTLEDINRTLGGNANNTNNPGDTSSDEIDPWEDTDIDEVNALVELFEGQSIIKIGDKKVARISEAQNIALKALNYPLTQEEEALHQKRKELEQKYAEARINKDESAQIFNIYAAPQEHMDKVYDQYKSSLTDRIKKHRLHAADFQVLMSDDEGDLRNVHTRNDHENIMAFREKFENTLNSFDSGTARIDQETTQTLFQFGDLIDPIDLTDTSTLEPFFQAIDKHLGRDLILNTPELKEALDSFESPQVKDEVIKGVLGYFHDRIETIVGKAMDAYNEYSTLNEEEKSAQKEFLLNNLRTQHKISSPQEVQRLENSYQQYFTGKMEHDKKVESERNLLEGALEGIEDEDERDRIRETFEFGTRCLNHGYEMDGEGNLFPGKLTIQEATLQTNTVVSDIGEICNTFSDEIVNLAGLLKKQDDPMKEDNRFLIDGFLSDWGVQKETLTENIKEFKRICREEIFNDSDDGEAFMRQYMPGIDMAFNDINTHVDLLQENRKFTGDEQLFGKIRLGFLNLHKWLNFSEGEVAGLQNNIENRLFSHVNDDNQQESGFSETVQSLKNYDVFGNDPQKATDKFRKVRAEFNKSFYDYESTIGKVNKRIKFDLQKLSDENFEKKYNITRSDAELVIERNQETQKDFNDYWKKYNEPNYFSEWIKSYKNGTDKEKFQAITEFQDFERLGNTAEIAYKDAESLNKWIQEWKEYGENERRNKWYNRMGTRQISLYSIYLIVKEAIDIVETRWKRKQDSMAYQLGQELFGDSPWGKEFRRKAEESEEERVKQWESNYDELNVWEVAKYLYKTNDSDEAKACINVLNKKGYLKWDNPQLWRTLMRLNKGVSFLIPEDMSLDINEIAKKVGRSCEVIWSKEVFRQWDTEMDENMSKAKSSREKEFRDLTDVTMENGASGLSTELAGMLERWNRGETAEVYPDKFVAFLNLAFAQGKLNSQPDKRWYYLIKGVSTKNPQGQPLISKSVFMQFTNELLSNMPYFEFFVDKGSWKKNGAIVPEGTPGAHTGPWTYEDYMGWGDMMGDNGGSFLVDTSEAIKDDVENFFYEVVDMSPAARGRVKRMGRTANQNADHDDGETFFTGLETSEVMQMLSSSSQGNQQASNDFWRAWLAGFDRYMRQRKRIIKKNDTLYHDNPNWPKEKKEILLDVGEKLKAAVAVSQTLSGTKTTERTTPLIWNEAEWEESKKLTLKKAQTSKDEINSMMFSVLDQKGDPDNLKEVLTADFYTKGSTKQIKEAPGWTDANTKVEKLISDEGGGVYFRDTNVILKALENYNGV